MGNGGILGKRNSPSRSRASGVWGLHDLYLNRMHSEWPNGNLQVEVGSFTKSSSTGNQDITIATDLTSAPAGSWAVIFWTTASNTAAGMWSTNGWGVHTSLGFVANGGGSISQYAVGASMEDGAATSNTSRRMVAAAITLTNYAANAQDEATFSSFPTATSMRLNWTSQGFGLSTREINYAIISGLSNAKVVNWTTPISAGSKAVTGVGFSPDLVLHAGDTFTNAAIPQSAGSACFQFGAMNRHGQQWANAFISADNAADSMTSRYQQTDACLIAVDNDGSENPREQAHFSSMDSDGFTVYFSTTVGGSAQQRISLCLDGVSSKIGAFTKTTAAATAAQTVDSRQGFTPKGALFSTFSLPPTAAPSAQGRWALGASDLTNERVVGVEDTDASATTNAKSVWHNDKAIIRVSGSGSTVAAADLSSVDDDSFSLSWTTNDSNETEVLYLLLGDSGTDTTPRLTVPDFGVYNAPSTSTAYSNQKKATELSDGSQVQILKDGSGNVHVVRSTDQWLTKTDLTTLNYIAGWSNGSIDAYVDSGGTERLVAVWKQNGTGGGRTSGLLYMMVGTFNADRTTLTWGTALALTGDTFNDVPDVVATVNAAAGSTSGLAVLAYAYGNFSTNNQTVVAAYSIAGTTIAVIGGSGFTSTLYTNGARTYPSITMDKTTTRAFVAWSTGATGSGLGIRFRTATWNGSAFTWATEVEVSTSRYLPNGQYDLVCRYDGTTGRVLIGGHPVINGTNYATFVAQITAASTYTSAGLSHIVDVDHGVSGAAAYFGGSLAINPDTGDFYIFGHTYNGSIFVGVTYRKFTQATSTLGSAVTVDSSTWSGSDPAYISAFPVTGGIGWIYTRGNNSPYSVVYDRLELS